MNHFIDLTSVKESGNMFKHTGLNVAGIIRVMTFIIIIIIIMISSRSTTGVYCF